MLIRTHLLTTLFFVLLFFSSTNNQIIFVVVAFMSTLMPDIDTKFSVVGRKKIFRLLQFFVRHRGVLHSFTFLILVTLFFASFIPVFAFPFFLGYGLHLLADSFTLEGICPFYPLSKRVFGKIKTGGKSEVIVFVGFLVGDFALILIKILSLF
ncbi:MAG: metal-dependent hydrolase [Nanoarchaeota archaeon]|nr:metal-dependent hydrolase [Nanoarchaeota archaeon]